MKCLFGHEGDLPFATMTEGNSSEREIRRFGQCRAAQIAAFAVLLILALLPMELLAAPKVAVLYSDYTMMHRPNPAFYTWEISGTFSTLKSLGVSYGVLHDGHFTLTSLKGIQLLILPDTQDMSGEEVQAVENFAFHGGKVLATGFASYRNENDQPAGIQNNFQLSTLFGADYLRYSPYPPEGGRVEAGYGYPIFLGRNRAIQIMPHPGARIIGTWLNDDGRTESFPGKLDAAIVENHSGSCVYAGENLFDPENAQNPDVVELLANLMNFLVPDLCRIPVYVKPQFPTLPKLGVLPPISTSSSLIQVGLPYPPENGFILSDSPIEVFLNGKRISLRTNSAKIPFQWDPSGFLIEGKKGANFRFTPLDSRYPLKVILRHGPGALLAPYHLLAFRGSAILRMQNQQRLLVNELPLEDYLAGVVSHEVPFYFHMEALKTMAVVARTFAIKEKSEKKFNGYDICATVECQAYDGLEYESSRSRQAVRETAGDVVTYKGNLADLPYHATCGGITEAIQNAWNLKPVPYLRSVVDGPGAITENLATDAGVEQFLLHPPDSYCKASSRFRWKESYSVMELEALFRQSIPVLLKRPVNFGKLESMEVSKRSPSGRVMELRIITSTGTFRIKKDQIRWLFSGGQLGLGGLQSTLFVILRKGNNYTFLGGGWGHGVGMCQFGAEGMAQLGFDYKKILSHYFPGIQVVNLQPGSAKDHISK